MLFPELSVAIKTLDGQAAAAAALNKHAKRTFTPHLLPSPMEEQLAFLVNAFEFELPAVRENGRDGQASNPPSYQAGTADSTDMCPDSSSNYVARIEYKFFVRIGTRRARCRPVMCPKYLWPLLGMHILPQ